MSQLCNRYQNKILGENHSEIISSIKAKNKSIVFTNGCFDILHVGHIHILSKAKELGDILIVGVNSDDSVERLKGRHRPIIPIESRINVLAALEMTDFIIEFSEDTPLRLIQEIQPDVLVKGGDYEVKTIVGSDFVLKRGGKVEIVEILEGFSTTDIELKIQNKIKKS
ncbi:MAG: D-glycero-beta-D-manno-heptose 1-phosphate adenylyltransferase [Chitinophagales bacterium]|nr:D-glycero-beta-D-manno-heptose 1-phosphate adenylyltransferase [Chitinophagales bacterium]